eukprot:4605557-Amphidinium_carterae.2
MAHCHQWLPIPTRTEEGEALKVRVGITVSVTGVHDGVMSRPITYIRRALAMAYFVAGLGMVAVPPFRKKIRMSFEINLLASSGECSGQAHATCQV